MRELTNTWPRGMRSRGLSVTAKSIMPRGGRPRRRHKISPKVRIAQASIRETMAEVIRSAKRAGHNLYLAVQDRTFDPVELQKEMAAGRFVMGRNWWQIREAH